MTIDDRIEFHRKHKERWFTKKVRLEAELNDTNTKIIFHWAAIQNLAIKKHRIKKEYL